MVVTHDEEHGFSYVYLAGTIPKGGVKRTITTAQGINLDLDAEGRLIGIELLSRHLLHPELAAVAVPPGRRD